MEAVASARQRLPWMVRAVDLRVLRQAQELPEEPEEGGEAMSMLISQAKELRTLADGLRKLYENGANLTRVQVAGMTTAVEAMREAADTITSLQDRLQAVGEKCELTAFADVPFNVDYEIEGYDDSSGRDYATLAECSKCGAYVIVPPAYHHVLTCDGDEVYQPYRYCPSCRREIKEVDA